MTSSAARSLKNGSGTTGVTQLRRYTMTTSNNPSVATLYFEAVERRWTGMA